MDNDLMEYQPGAFGPQAAAPRHGENPLLMVHHALRGRYVWVVLLGLLLAIPGAIGGYFALPPLYSSVAMVRVAPELQRNLYTLDENSLPPFFDSFVATQAAYITDRRVLRQAVEDPALTRAGWPTGDEGVSLLTDSIKVQFKSKSELIMVSVSHTTPLAAKEAVNAVLRAYEDIHGDQSRQAVSWRERALVERQDKLKRELGDHNTSLQSLAGEFGTVDLEGLHTNKVEEIEKLSNAISAIDLQLAAKNLRETTGDEVPPPAPPPEAELSVEALATLDETLSAKLKERRAIESQINRLRPRAGPENRDLKALNLDLVAVEAEIQARAEFLRKNPPRDADADAEAANIAKYSPEQLAKLRASYESIRADQASQAMMLVRTKLAIATRQEQITHVKEELALTSDGLNKIRVENEFIAAGRVSIAADGEMPLKPSADRRIPLAVAGALAGPALSVLIFACAGLIHRKYRYIDELESSDLSAPLLGTLPNLKTGEAGRDEIAALSVHHLRNMLQVQAGSDGDHGTVFAVTSASSGDGKTSLTLALGMSFALAGHRTVLLDADLVGRGLSRQLGLNGAAGLSEAVAAAALNGELHETRIRNLWAIPAGADTKFEPEHISQPDLKRLIAQLREQFDIVLIDTGPLLGSLEANLVSPLSDRVVLTVSRGQAAAVVQASLKRLVRLGATCAGLVFNRANLTDLERSTSQASVGGGSLRSLRAHNAAARPGDRAGPLARAVGGLPASSSVGAPPSSVVISEGEQPQ